jgi:DHA3 family tetracycline resistance protein-like MFS transporter
MLLRAFRNRPFALLWTGQTLSRIGDFLYEVALAWWVLEKTGSAEAMAAVLIVAFLPMLAFMLLGGVLVDRLPRAPVMLISDVARGIVVLGVTIFSFAGTLEIWHVYVAAFVFGLADAFFQPAFAAFVPDIVPENELPAANSVNSLGIQAGRIAGPALGGMIVAAGGTSVAFAVNTATFLISAAFLLPLLRVPRARGDAPAPEGDASPGTPPEPAGMLPDLKAGLRFVAQTPWLWASVLLFAVTNVTLSGPYSIALPYLVQARWDDPRVLGWLYAVFPAGYAAGSVWLGSRETIRRRGALIYLGGALAGAMLGLFGLPLAIIALAVAAFINGLALELSTLAWTNALQTRVPRQKLGRVSSVDAVGSFGLLPIGYALTGWATDLLGAPAVFLIGGGVTAAVSLLLYALLPAVRGLD